MCCIVYYDHNYIGEMKSAILFYVLCWILNNAYGKISTIEWMGLLNDKMNVDTDGTNGNRCIHRLN